MDRIAIDLLERHARGGTWSYDVETSHIIWSDGVYRLHGVTRESFTPTLDNAMAFYTAESRTRLEVALAQATAAGTGYSLTLEIRRADGVHRFVQAIGQVELRGGREPLLAGAVLDVHHQVVEQRAQQRREAELLTETRRWREASENAGLGLIDLDFDQGIYRIYGAFNIRVGLSDSDQAVFERWQWLGWVHPEDLDRRQQLLEAHLRGETEHYEVEYRLCLVPDAEPLWVKESGRRVEVDAGRRILGTLSDISARKHSERAIRQSRQRLRQTIEYAPIGIALVSPEGRWLTVNRELCEIVGYTETELLATNFQQITHPDDLEADLNLVRDLIDGRIIDYRLDKRYFHKSGHVVDIQLDVSLLRDERGEPLYFICHIQDVSERKRVFRELVEARELAEVTFDAIGEGVIRIGRDGVIVEANPAATALLGLPRERLLGRPFGEAVEFYDATEDRALSNPAAGVLADGERVRVPIFTRLRRGDGEYISIVDSLSPIHDDAGAVRGAVFVFQDISEAQRMTQELVHQASHDPLTGLPNRRGFKEALERTWRRVQQHALKAFVLYLDLDHFKTINDSCGHSAGDELLREIATRLRTMLRDSDVLARLGGDEFAAIVHVKDNVGVEVVADKLVRNVADFAFIHEGRRFAVGVSIGIAAIDPAHASTDVALVHADAALYVAKDSGRNRSHVYRNDTSRSGDGRAARYVDTAQLLQSGLEEDRFTLYLQAIVEADGRPVGYEALLRFEGPQGLVAPDAFLPTAKRLGMMSRIDRWVIIHALGLLSDYRARGLWPAHAYLSINLSPISLADPKFHAEMIALLDRHGDAASRLMFEVVESDALFGEHYPQLIQQLRDRGFRVWLDDFASGYNGFDMLKRASVDGVKIDRSFVSGIEKDAIDRAVIRSISDVSRALSLDVIAEGVETRTALDLLRRAGVTRFQGYLFHRPEPPVQALERARDQQTSRHPDSASI